MDTKLVKELIDLLDNSNLAKLEIKEKDFEIKLEKTVAQVVNYEPVTTIKENVVKEETKTLDTSKTIKSPIVGTFYSKPAPDALSFVSENQTINQGDVVCIIEAMKVMNEIKASSSAKIVKVLVNDGELVEFDQPLFIIE